MSDNYKRVLEMLLLYADTKWKLWALASIKIDRSGKHVFKLSIKECATDKDIYDYICEESHDLKEAISQFNEKVNTLNSIIKFVKSQDIYVTQCKHCGEVRVNKTKRNRICTRCIDRLGEGYPQRKIRLSNNSFVYLISNTRTGDFKIGYSRAPEIRIKQLQTGSSDRLALLCFIHGSKKTERMLQQKFSEYSIGGEWFSGEHEILEEFKTLFKMQSGEELRLSMEKEQYEMV